LNLFAFALALALIGAVIFLWAVSGKMVFAAVVALNRCHLLRLITWQGSSGEALEISGRNTANNSAKHS